MGRMVFSVAERSVLCTGLDQISLQIEHMSCGKGTDPLSQFNQADLVLNQSKPGSHSILPVLEREHFTLFSGIFTPKGTTSEFSEHSGK